MLWGCVFTSKTCLWRNENTVNTVSYTLLQYNIGNNGNNKYLIPVYISIYIISYHIINGCITIHMRKTEIKDKNKCKFIILRVWTSHFSQFSCMWYILYKIELRAYVILCPACNITLYIPHMNCSFSNEKNICAVSQTNASCRSYNNPSCLKMFTVNARILWVSWILT